jgi:transcriptional repressor NrdR
MVCLYCGSDTRVTNSRPQKRSNRIWRRRHCLDCGAIFTTVEGIDYSASVSFKHPSGTLQPFERDQLFVSVLDSIRHRKTATSDATSLTDTILIQLASCRDEDGGINRNQLVQLVFVTLSRFDSAAGVHYRAFHPVKD